MNPPKDLQIDPKMENIISNSNFNLNFDIVFYLNDDEDSYLEYILEKDNRSQQEDDLVEELREFQ